MPGIPKIITILWTLTCPGCPADVGSPMGISGTRHPEIWGAELQPPICHPLHAQTPNLPGGNQHLPAVPHSPHQHGGVSEGCHAESASFGNPAVLTWELVWKLQEREARQALPRLRVGGP